jgi:hypothetical protein
MPLPPEWLVEWTKFLSLVAAILSVVPVLLSGGKVLRLKLAMLRKQLTEDAKG